MESWEMEMHVPFLNDLFSFPTSLARSGPSEVIFFGRTGKERHEPQTTV